MPMPISISGSCVVFMITAGLALAVVAFRHRRANVATAHLRGRSLRTSREAQTLLDQKLSSRDPGLQLGTLRVPSEAAYSHLALVGATGSGKTLLQRLLLQSVLPRIGQGFGHRALIYDAKQDVLSVLAGMRLSCPIRTLIESRLSA